MCSPELFVSALLLATHSSHAPRKAQTRPNSKSVSLRLAADCRINYLAANCENVWPKPDDADGVFEEMFGGGSLRTREREGKDETKPTRSEEDGPQKVIPIGRFRQALASKSGVSIVFRCVTLRERFRPAANCYALLNKRLAGSTARRPTRTKTGSFRGVNSTKIYRNDREAPKSTDFRESMTTPRTRVRSTTRLDSS